MGSQNTLSPSVKPLFLNPATTVNSRGPKSRAGLIAYPCIPPKAHPDSPPPPDPPSAPLNSPRRLTPLIRNRQNHHQQQSRPDRLILQPRKRHPRNVVNTPADFTSQDTPETPVSGNNTPVLRHKLWTLRHRVRNRLPPRKIGINCQSPRHRRIQTRPEIFPAMEMPTVTASPAQRTIRNSSVTIATKPIPSIIQDKRTGELGQRFPSTLFSSSCRGDCNTCPQNYNCGAAAPLQLTSQCR